MQGYGVNIVVEGGELEKILARLSAAQEEIQQCYFELERLGVLVIKKPSDESENETCSYRNGKAAEAKGSCGYNPGSAEETTAQEKGKNRW